MTNRRISAVILLLFSLCAMPLTATAQQETVSANNNSKTAPPVLEVIDHSRHLKIITTTADWSFSPLGKYGITMVHNPGFSTLRFKQESFSKDPVEIRNKYLANEQENENSEMMSEDVKVKVGPVEAVGMSFYVPKSKKKFLRVWFLNGEQMYMVEMQAKEENFEAFVKQGSELLGTVQFLKPAE